jgi:hypothetical protein
MTKHIGQPILATAGFQTTLPADILRTMRFSISLIALLAAVFSSCRSAPPPATPTTKAEPPKPADESRHFPKANLVNTKVVDKELLGKPFMPGGTLAHYKKGKSEYDMFLAKLPTPLDAAILLPDWNKALAGSKLIPSFGGYFGQDACRPVFVFSKGAWIAGVAGLPEKEADAAARTLAGQIQ